MKTENAVGLKVGDVLASSWGYSMTINSYYVVTRVTKCFATVEEIAGGCVEETGFCEGFSKPVPSQKVEGKPLRRKIFSYGARPFVCITDYENAYLWDGEPLYFNHND